MTDTPEHPAISSARAILQLHIDNIKMIDDGFVFHDKDGNNVNEKMRAACKEQIEMCEEIIDTASSIENQELLAPLTPIMADAKATIEKALEDAKDPLLPEISDYDNDNPPASG